MGADGLDRPETGQFGHLLRQYRIAAALSQEALAERAGLSARAVSDLERGVKTRPHLETVRLLADALKLSADDQAALASAARPERSSEAAGTEGSATSRLPRPLTSLIGRDEEVASITALLTADQTRLVNLIGPGGVGKTRLALAVADELLSTARDGVWFVPLAPASDPAHVLPAIAGVLGVREQGGRPLQRAVSDFLAAKSLVIVLDNFEHVLEAAPVVSTLLEAAPGVRVLATSRAPLRLRGEQEYPVKPLSLPGEKMPVGAELVVQSEAVRLFVERAQLIRPDLPLTDEHVRAIGEICRRLDGLPLAIELAAARSRLFTPVALLSRLDQRLPILTGGPRDLPERHQTLRSTIAWSYDLLTSSERTMFRRLAVFAGGFTLDAAEAVACDDGEAVDTFGTLIHHNLVRRIEQPAGYTRFGMLETIREFGLEQLVASGEEAILRSRHLAYYLEVAEQADRIPYTPRDGDANRRLEVEQPNLRAALEWATGQNEAEYLLRLVAALWWFWDWSGRGSLTEGCGWMDRALAATVHVPKSLHGIRARVLILDIQGAMLQGTTDNTAALLDEAMLLARETGDARAINLALLALGNLAIIQGDLDHAEAHLSEALTRARTEGATRQSLDLLNWLAWVHTLRNDWEAAESLYAEYLEAARASGWQFPVAHAIECLGTCARERHDHRGAAELFAEALTLVRDEGEPAIIANCLKSLGAVAAVAGQAEQASRLFGASEAILERMGFREPQVERARLDQVVAPARTAISSSAFASAWASGRALPLEEAIAEALEVAETVAAGQPCPPAVPAGLTPRELDVLRLLVEGLSDREIAGVLFVSRHTANNHVGSILSKLGVPSRAAAAAWAVRNDLA